MSTIDLIVNFFKQGGAFLYPIAAVFVIGLVVAVVNEDGTAESRLLVKALESESGLHVELVRHDAAASAREKPALRSPVHCMGVRTPLRSPR